MEGDLWSGAGLRHPRLSSSSGAGRALHQAVRYFAKESLARRTRGKYRGFLKKYNRFEKRHKKLSAHMSPAFLDVELGDIVCRRGGLAASPAAGARARGRVRLRARGRALTGCTRAAPPAGHCWPVPPALEDGALQRAEGGQARRRLQEVQEVLEAHCLFLVQ